MAVRRAPRARPRAQDLVRQGEHLLCEPGGEWALGAQRSEDDAREDHVDRDFHREIRSRAAGGEADGRADRDEGERDAHDHARPARSALVDVHRDPERRGDRYPGGEVDELPAGEEACERAEPVAHEPRPGATHHGPHPERLGQLDLGR